MKSKITLFLLFFFIVNFSFADKISETEAKLVGKNAFGKFCLAENKAFTLDSISTFEVISDDNGEQLFYIINYFQGGYIVISAEDCAWPILAYSTSGSMSQYYLHSNVNQWFKNYEEEIKAIRNQKLSADLKIQNAWNYYKGLSTLIPLSGGSVAPLTTTLWSQGTYYNDSTPVDNNGPSGHVVTGCVATAMAQIMKYHNFPPNGSGWHSYVSNYGPLTANFANASYNFSLMPNAPNSSSTSAEIAQICQLMSHCGISVNMQYTAGSSGAYSVDAKDAFIHYFNYSKNIQFLDKMNYSDSIWAGILRNELDSNRVVYYSGSGNGAHAFVCDGYQNDTYFHFNWGWAGSQNGYFYTNALNPGGYNFSNYSSIIVGIKPDLVTACQSNQILNQATGSFSDGSVNFNYNAASNCQWLIQPNAGVEIKLKFFTFTLAAGDTVKVYGGNSMTSPLLGTFTGAVVPTTITSSSSSMLVTFTSDLVAQGAGFSATYSVNFCHGASTLTNPADTFEDGSGIFSYNDNTLCSWLIQPVNAQKIAFEFLNFQTESGFDFVKVYDGVNSSANLLGSFSGNVNPGSLLSSGGSLYIEFVVDGGVVDQGWKAKYTTCYTPTIPTSNNTSFCDGDSILLHSNLPNGSFHWNHNNQIVSSSNNNFYAKDGGIWKVVTDSGACPSLSSQGITLTKNPKPAISIGNDTSICIESGIDFLAPTGYSSYLWSTGSSSQILHFAPYSFSLGYSNISLLVFDNNGCKGEDSLVLYVKSCLGMDNIDILNLLISPNPNTGTFEIQGIENSTDSEIAIFDEIGKEISFEIERIADKIIIHSGGNRTGIYFVRIFNGKQVYIKKVVLI